MADNRTRRPKGKKGALGGHGWQQPASPRRQGPHPKAEDRTYHPAYKKKQAADAAKRSIEARTAPRALRPGLQLPEGHELIAGRNPVIEAVRSGIPLTRVFMIGSAVSDERVGEVVRTATALGAPLLEVSRSELDRMTDDAVHQGVAIEVPPYNYATIDDLLERGSRKQAPGPHRGARFGDGSTQPRRRAAIGQRLLGRRHFDSRTPFGRRERDGVEGLGRCRGTRPGCAGDQSGPFLEYLKKAGYFVVGLDGGGDTEIGELTVRTCRSCL